MKRYSIVGRMHGSDHDTEIVQVDSNPEAMRAALNQKTLTIKHSIFLSKGGGKKTKVQKYSWLRIIDNAEGRD